MSKIERQMHSQWQGWCCTSLAINIWFCLHVTPTIPFQDHLLELRAGLASFYPKYSASDAESSALPRPLFNTATNTT